jgi:hypothetical protein
MLTMKRSIQAAAMLALTAFAVEAAPAAPAQLAAVTAADTSTVTQVQYYRGRGWGGGWRGGWRGPGIGLGIGAGIVAGAIIADRAYGPRRGYYYDTYAYDGPYYYPADYQGDPRRICAQHFRSFEWRTGLYTTYGGERRMCPYLR